MSDLLQEIEILAELAVPLRGIADMPALRIWFRWAKAD